MSLKQAAQDFEREFTGKLDAAKLAAIVKEIETADSSNATSFDANGSVASMIFYLKFQVDAHGHQFNGDAGGASLPGGGAMFGTMFIADGHTEEELYQKTTGFWFMATLVYTALYFYDKNGDFLGHFQAGSVSTVLGSGGGAGSFR